MGRRLLAVRGRTRRPVLAAALASAVFVPGTARGAAEPIPVHGPTREAAGTDMVEFSLTVAVGRSGVIAACDAGCAWREATATYEAGVYHLTREGISPAPPVRRGDAGEEPSAFYLVLTTDGRTVSATCERGCAWRSASAEYAAPARFTEAGIEPVGPNR